MFILYLIFIVHQIPEPEQTGDGPEKKITRLAIGVEGGFDPECGKPKFTYTDHYNVVVLPGFHTFSWPNDALPEVVSITAASHVGPNAGTNVGRLIS